MSQQQLLYGIGGLLIGVLLGLAFSAGGLTKTEVGDAVAEQLAPVQEAAEQSTASHQDAIAALGERIAALEASIPDAGSMTEQVSSAVSERLTGLRDNLSEAISNAVDEQKTSLDDAMLRISSGLERSAQAAAAAVASATTGDKTTAENVTVSDPLNVGQTAIFADGKVRAFISRIDPSGGGVTLSVNGERMNLGAGGSAPVSFDETDCTLVVMGIADEGVALGSDCVATEEEGEADSTEAAAAQSETESAASGADAEASEDADAAQSEEAGAESETESTGDGSQGESGDAGASDAEEAEAPKE
ncbi:hypothetical protein R5H30_03270 [Sulfitobacter sp. D35]|uniref:hypothetical protein n=1 Tax=Sulfitobacter sp. D35 TaxID=3083252 RepID=UPI00296F01E7|nr:hypothetical protein [Sulfitobacter sp. D35]MDW4496990.1 hypothetical protein [Sulfitobacter sp. D35]